MSFALGNPPMVEALCEFFFEGETEWDWTIPGRFYAEVAEEYPQRREKRIARVILSANESEEAAGPYRIQLMNAEVSRAVQLGVNWLGVHRMQPYGEWSDFKAQIETMLGLYRQIAQPEKLFDVNLYFRHQFQLPVEGFPLEQLMPQFPAALDLGSSSWLTWNQSIDIDRREKKGIARVQSGAFFDPVKIPPRFLIVDVKRGVGVGVMLNLQFGFNADKPLEWEELDDWLENAHEELAQLRARSFSDSAWESMQENSNDDH